MKYSLIGFVASILIAVILVINIPVSAEQQSKSISVYYAPIHFVFDGKELRPPEGQYGFIYEGSTYVPLRFISYALNKGVKWDGDTYTVTIDEPNIQQATEISDYVLNREVRGNSTSSSAPVIVPDPTQIDAYFEKVQYIFDGTQKQPSDDLPGMIYQDSLYVPMRFFSEAVGKHIDWDPMTYTVLATTAGTVGPTEPNPTATPSPTPPVTGGNGVVVSKPSYESLLATSELSIAALRDEAFSYYLDLYFEYSSADAQGKIALKNKGLGKLSEFDSRFEGIMADLEYQLSTNGYSLDKIATYRIEYEKQKASAKSFIE